MSTLQIGLLISYIANIVLIGTFLLYFYPKVKQSYLKRKKLRENKRDKQRNMEQARLVKTIRAEVRRYLEELQN